MRVLAEHPREELAALEVHDHSCSLYETPEELRLGFVPYLQTGLLRKERCVYFVDENTPEFVIDAMQADGFHIQSHIDSGAFEIISTADAQLKGGYFDEQKMLAYWQDALEKTRRAGYTAMRVAVEMTWALSGKPGCDILAPYESRLTRFMQTHDASVLCMYSRKRFSAEKIKAIVHAHPIIVDVDTVLENPCCIKPDTFRENDAAQDVRALLDNLTQTRDLRKAHSEIKVSHDEFQNLCYVISHELQEPLASLKSYQKLLAVRHSGKLGADADEFIRRCTQSVDAIDGMIDDLWKFARISVTGRQFGEANCSHALETALRQIAPLLEQRPTEIQYNELPVVWGIEEQLSLLFSELLENAIIHNHADTRVVTVTCHNTNGLAHITMEDNGNGIDPMNRAQAFKLFNRLGKRPSSHGTGMGLPICKKIVEHHGGSIAIERGQHRGTVVHLLLPTSAHSRSIRAAG